MVTRPDQPTNNTEQHLPPAIEWRGPDLLLRVRIQTRASQDEIVGLHGDHLKIRITAPPVDGKANTHLIKLLARVFAVAPSDIEILSGHSAREKRFCVHAPRSLPAQIHKLLPPASTSP